MFWALEKLGKMAQGEQSEVISGNSLSRSRFMQPEGDLFADKLEMRVFRIFSQRELEAFDFFLDLTCSFIHQRFAEILERSAWSEAQLAELIQREKIESLLIKFFL